MESGIPRSKFSQNSLQNNQRHPLGILKFFSKKNLKILKIPVSNAFVERVFSLANVQWTKERNLLEVETVKSLLLVTVNFDLSCKEMHEMLLGNKKLLEKISGWEKYK